MDIIGHELEKHNVISLGNQVFLGAKVFYHPQPASEAGLYSRTTWLKQGRLVREDQLGYPAGIVVTEANLIRGISVSPIIGSYGNGKYLEASGYWVLFNLDQTEPKPQSKRGRKKASETSKDPRADPSVFSTSNHPLPIPPSIMMLETSQIVGSQLFECVCPEEPKEPVNNDVNSQGPEGKGASDTRGLKSCPSPRRAMASPMRQHGGKVKENSLKVYWPEGLVLPDDCPFKAEIQCFVNLLYRKHLEDRTPFNEPVPLMAVVLRQNFPNWSQIWRQIERLALCGRDYYIKGSKSYGYFVLEPYRSQRHRLVTIMEPELVKRQRKAKEQSLRGPTTKFLAAQLERLTVDRGACEERFTKHSDWFYLDAHLRVIEDKQWQPSEDDFGGRFYSPLTRMYKCLRPYLRVDGEPDSLGELDIANSQPLFLGLAALEKGIEDRKYLQLCEEGRIYDHVAGLIGLERSSAKTEVLTMLYSRNGHQSLVKAVFKRLFPQMAEFVANAKKKDHNRLSRWMQKAERRFVIDRVCGRLMKLRPELFLATIHDSILARKSDCDFIQDIMAKEFARLGVKPSLRWRDTASDN